MTRAADDDARWAEALSIVERAPTPSAERRLRSVRRNRLLAISTFIVLTVVVAMVLALLVLDLGRDEADQDVPTWRAVVGLAVSGLGLVVIVAGLVLLLRVMRGRHGWRGALDVLTVRQRRELIAQLRGRAPLMPERLPLVRATADQLIAQRLALVPQVGFLLLFLGQRIGDRSAWRLVVVVVFAVVLLTAAVLGQRDVQDARRFLDEYPGVETARD